MKKNQPRLFYYGMSGKVYMHTFLQNSLKVSQFYWPWERSQKKTLPRYSYQSYDNLDDFAQRQYEFGYCKYACSTSFWYAKKYCLPGKHTLVEEHLQQPLRLKLHDLAKSMNLKLAVFKTTAVGIAILKL
jgi:hypothetical protein